MRPPAALLSAAGALALAAALLPACSGDKGSTGADSAAEGDADTDADADSDTDIDVDCEARLAEGKFFPDGAVWFEDVSGAPTDPTSEEVITFLQGYGWGLGRLQIDFSIEVLTADADTPKMSFDPSPDYFYSPDCDQQDIPIPEGGALEGEAGYSCSDYENSDCHLIVADCDAGRLYEMWKADIDGANFQGGCLAVWDMNTVYGPEGRGEQCTSADAAGYPIAQLLFTADEVAAGHIDHAIRFILPNDAIRDSGFIAPATHATTAGDDPPSGVLYGAHLRLRADYPVDTLPNEASKVVARALQTYGMYLADGGNVALTARSDRSTTAKWADLMESRDLEDIEPADFELLEMGPEIPLTFDCAR